MGYPVTMYELVIPLCILAIAMIAVIAGTVAIVKQPGAATNDPSDAGLSIRGVAKGRVRGPTGLLLAFGGLALATVVAYMWLAERFGEQATVSGTVALTDAARETGGHLVVVLAQTGHTRHYGGMLPDSEEKVEFMVATSGQYYAFAFNIVDIVANGQALYHGTHKPVTVSDGKGVFSLELGSR